MPLLISANLFFILTRLVLKVWFAECTFAYRSFGFGHNFCLILIRFNWSICFVSTSRKFWRWTLEFWRSLFFLLNCLLDDLFCRQVETGLVNIFASIDYSMLLGDILFPLFLLITSLRILSLNRPIDHAVSLGVVIIITFFFFSFYGLFDFRQRSCLLDCNLLAWRRFKVCFGGTWSRDLRLHFWGNFSQS